MPRSASPRTTASVRKTARTAPRKSVPNMASPRSVAPVRVCSSTAPKSGSSDANGLDLLEGLARAEAVEPEEGAREEEDDQEDAAAQALLERIADDRGDRPHVASSPTALRYVSSSVVVRTRTP